MTWGISVAGWHNVWESRSQDEFLKEDAKEEVASAVSQLSISSSCLESLKLPQTVASKSKFYPWSLQVIHYD